MARALLWFRRDLRLTDNPALQAALSECREVIPLYISAPEEEYPWPPGGASRWWLHHSLHALDHQLKSRSSRLLILAGPTLETLRSLIQQQEITHLFWNRLYEPALCERDSHIERELKQEGIDCRSFNAALLCEPRTISTRSGTPYRVFTPFWRACEKYLMATPPPHAAPDRVPSIRRKLSGLKLEALGLLPRSGWDRGLARSWNPGELGALEKLRLFQQQGGVEHYNEQRDLPGIQGTSRLSPHLHFGEIGPRQIIHALRTSQAAASTTDSSGLASFRRQLGWREFAHHLLYHFPHTDQSPMNPKFAEFPWTPASRSVSQLRAWQQGQCGIPMVDAGMRELWQTGWMHNRVRMIVASLLTKNLGIHWREGACWFWDTLVDADLPNNSLGWQWTAGCGADAAPFYRIFNPVRQGERFDPDGAYIRRWVPELAKLPTSRLHAPWKCDEATLADAGVTLGKSYPLPIVDLHRSRKQALIRWKSTMNNSDNLS
ncbi:MAG: deoxyribodipyrimidine photo-lyase [Candidatus Thiodiazotropha sp.]|jgi:deoxyribodipyrimidine photo-lyase